MLQDLAGNTATGLTTGTGIGWATGMIGAATGVGGLAGGTT